MNSLGVFIANVAGSRQKSSNGGKQSYSQVETICALMVLPVPPYADALLARGGQALIRGSLAAVGLDAALSWISGMRQALISLMFAPSPPQPAAIIWGTLASSGRF